MDEERVVHAGAETARRIAALIERAIQEERQACAAIAEELAAGERGRVAREIAERIRGRSESAT